jgi:dolichol-phosphate mannosyltransferase
MDRALVIIPTYNERETLPVAIGSVLAHEGLNVLVVDDSSSDGTANYVRTLMRGEARVFLVERPEKLGLGTAYSEGFRWGLARDYEYFIEMDADGSHDPSAIPSFLSEMRKGYGLVIGSRYLNGNISVVGWDFRRLLLSKFGNLYASRVLRLMLTDVTSGFRCYSKTALERIDLDNIHSNGYSFQIEMAYRVSAAGFRVAEIPIIFCERTSGVSKMSKKIVREAIVLPWRLRLGRLFRPGGGINVKDLEYNIRTISGFFFFGAGALGSAWLGYWLSTEGDIVESIHRVKMGLPDWAWIVMKIGLSGFSVLAALLLVLGFAIGVFGSGGRK